MTPQRHRGTEVRKRGFTLIEMLVVIGVIGILAAMIVGLAPLASNSRINARAKGELEQLITAIEAYKAKKGFYPPSNPKDDRLPPLYYELIGTKKTPDGVYHTLDGKVSITQAEVRNGYNIEGFVNSTTVDATGSIDPDQGPAQTFHENIKTTQTLRTNEIVYLGIPSKGSDGDFSKWRYNSIAPKHNKDSYDLWIELTVRGKTNIYGNWKQ
jgi:prepilin-type N-terminal cleavage/methylation domain-containing protein